MRFKEGNDFPYFKTTGMSQDFVRLENSLCPRKHNNDNTQPEKGGEIVLDCACGCVLQGRVDRSEPFVTEYGSIWTNSNTISSPQRRPEPFLRL